MEAGAVLADDARSLAAAADVFVTVGRPERRGDRGVAARNAYVVGFLIRWAIAAFAQRLAAANLTALAMEMIPRITRAQAMDALSSQSNIAGYKAVLLAAAALPKFFPMLTTAAGTIPPAKVLILGAGVAGLQAIATARRLGAVVSGYDVRAVVKEQVAVARREVSRVRPRRRRAKARAATRKELTPEQQRATARWMVEADRRSRRRDHDRAGAGPARADSHHRGRGRGDEARQRHRRPRRRSRRQLRADRHRARSITTPNGVTIVGTTNLPCDDADRREPALLAQRATRCSRP